MGLLGTINRVMGLLGTIIHVMGLLETIIHVMGLLGTIIAAREGMGIPLMGVMETLGQISARGP